MPMAAFVAEGWTPASVARVMRHVSRVDHIGNWLPGTVAVQPQSGPLQEEQEVRVDWSAGPFVMEVQTRISFDPVKGRIAAAIAVGDVSETFELIVVDEDGGSRARFTNSVTTGRLAALLLKRFPGRRQRYADRAVALLVRAIGMPAR